MGKRRALATARAATIASSVIRLIIVSGLAMSTADPEASMIV